MAAKQQYSHLDSEDLKKLKEHLDLEVLYSLAEQVHSKMITVQYAIDTLSIFATKKD